jgi:hypothetical protein
MLSESPQLLHREQQHQGQQQQEQQQDHQQEQQREQQVHQTHHQRLLRRLLLSVLFTCWLFVFRSLVSLFAVFNCTAVFDGAVKQRNGPLIASALWEHCDLSSPRYAALFAVAILLGPAFAIVTVSVFVPIGSRWRWPQTQTVAKARIHEAQLDHQQSHQQSLPLSSATTMTTTTTPWSVLDEWRAFASAPYRDACAHWEVVQALRRVVLAMVLALSPYGSLVLPLLVCLVIVLSLGAHLWVLPFRAAVDNAAEAVSLLLLLLTFLTGLIMTASSAAGWDPNHAAIAAWVAVIANAIFVGVLVAAAAWTRATRGRRLARRKTRDANAWDSLAAPSPIRLENVDGGAGLSDRLLAQE